MKAQLDRPSLTSIFQVHAKIIITSYSEPNQYFDDIDESTPDDSDEEVRIGPP